MPHIKVTSNVPIPADKETKIKEILGMCINFIPGKSENWLMVEIEGDKNLYFKGTKATPCCFVDFKILGTVDKGMCKKVTGIITKNIAEILGIQPMNIYICFMATPFWGWSGEML